MCRNYIENDRNSSNGKYHFRTDSGLRTASVKKNALSQEIMKIWSVF
jgi:hypothetical protein